MTTPNVTPILRAFSDSQEQPAPRPSTAPAMWDLVRSDITEWVETDGADMPGPPEVAARILRGLAMIRDQLGTRRYGTRLHADNGRDMLADHLQERLDGLAYLRGAIYDLEHVYPERDPDGLLAVDLRAVYRYDLNALASTVRVWVALQDLP